MQSSPIALRLLVGFAALLSAAIPALASDQPFTLHLELGAGWQEKNTVQIPNDEQGTRFSLADLAGSGPWTTIRVEGTWDINDKHGLRFLLAPLSYSESGQLETETRFAGQSYSPDESVKAEYRFNSWRLGYRYHWIAHEHWDLWVGGTLKVRDAEIRLTQGDTSSKDDDIGLVPLLYLGGEYRISDHWSLSADLDGLAGGPGRAIDLGIRLNYTVDQQWKVGLGYRTLEGGADTDDVYNFAWFNSLVFSADYLF
jgi:hypothetical protein